jgi:hypothetical protein
MYIFHSYIHKQRVVFLSNQVPSEAGKLSFLLVGMRLFICLASAAPQCKGRNFTSDYIQAVVTPVKISSCALRAFVWITCPRVHQSVNANIYM